jgi:hypothetical protein
MNEHIEAGKRHANREWKKAALAVVKHLAKKNFNFTSADVLAALAKADVRTHDLRAIGGVMVEARDCGFIESTGLVRRNDKHSRGATTLWKGRRATTNESESFNR